MLKVRRHLLPQPDQTAVLVESTEAIDDPIGQAVSAVARQLGTVSPEQTLAELGIDSLGLVELTATIESKTGKLIADQDLSLTMTMEQLRARVAARRAQIVSERKDSTSGTERVTMDVPAWPYGWGRVFRFLGAPFHALLRLAATRIEVLGEEHLADLPPASSLPAHTMAFPICHSFDMPWRMVRGGIWPASCCAHFRRADSAVVAFSSVEGWALIPGTASWRSACTHSDSGLSGTLACADSLASPSGETQC